MVDALRQTKLEHLCLKSPLQEVLNLQSKHVIETHAVLIKHTNANETANEGVTLEKTLGVLGVEFEQLTGGTTNFREHKRDAPDFALVSETVLAGELEPVLDREAEHRKMDTPSTRRRDVRIHKVDGGPCNCITQYKNGAWRTKSAQRIPPQGGS